MSGIGARLLCRALWFHLAYWWDEFQARNFPYSYASDHGLKSADVKAGARKRDILTTVPAAPVGPGVILSDVKFDYQGDMHLECYCDRAMNVVGFPDDYKCKVCKRRELDNPSPSHTDASVEEESSSKGDAQ